LYRPWCYTDHFCTQDFCDVANLGTCHDIYNNCADLLTEEYCDSDEGLYGCKKSCSLCTLGVTERAFINPSIDIEDPNAYTIDPIPASGTYKDGDKVRFLCSETNGEEITNLQVFGFDEREALTDGTWSGRKVICGVCPAGWYEFNGNCYAVFTESLNFLDAAAKCNDFNADLVSLLSHEEHVYVYELAESHGVYDLWIGLTEDVGEYNTYPRFKWLDGNPSAYLRWWYRNKPNNGGSNGEDCTAVIKKSGRYWDDKNCNATMKFICKRMAE
ncbi:unnamed protein product, partial [Owenia fusiformis]